MPSTIIVGSQWGDEGKGKIVDLLARNVDIVARYQGGANAGHTIKFKDQQFVLHLIPSGIFHPNVTCVIGNGVVIDPVALVSEIEAIKNLGIDISGRLLISHNAHLIMPYHKILDSVSEAHQGNSKIGTTGRGIGPAYYDKAARTGIKIVDLLDRDILSQKLRKNLEAKNELLKKIYNVEELNIDNIIQEYVEFDKKIDEYITNTVYYLNNALKEGKKLILEGAQGALLDIDHGTYPYVTSSNPISGGACTGLGIPPTAITSVLGVVKAYTTRVGYGPYPTEQDNEIGETLRKIGSEYGATTGRPRRCGWLDIMALQYSIMINGIKYLAITKLDVLDALDEIKICTGYRVGSKILKTFPNDLKTLEQVEPIYETFPGWKSSISDIRSFDKLPENCQKYLKAIEDLTETPIKIVSVGPEREQTFVVD
ncbi:MAG TPA: adenylosuccinate synthase [Bacteroidota bacterium]|jgi:adenylosuccinate synthase|nr:adenylosuccinate synthase [Bacteroidota bacterium]